jgi:hypothetical protein
MFNYSFWADEAYVSGVAAQLILGKISLVQAFIAMPYQRLYVLFLGMFFKLFGISEFTARLPSLLFFLIGVIAIFLTAKKLSNIYGGLVSSFLYIFSYLNLSYATQAKPYGMLESIALLVILLLIHIDTCVTSKAANALRYVSIFILLCIATFLHTIGVLLWAIYIVYIVIKFKKIKLYYLISFGFILAIISFVSIPQLSNRLLSYDHSYQVIKLFAFKYSLIIVSAIIGFILPFKKHKQLSVAIAAYSLLVLILATFQQYIFNIRYVLTLFGLVFLYFGIFWAKVGERFQFKIGGKAIIPIAVMFVIYITGYKIVRVPQAYYNPNIDKYGDVQIANYKDFYTTLKKRFPKYKSMYIVNDTFDAEYWYMGRYSNAYFMKFAEKPYVHGTAKVMIYGSLTDFKNMMKKHPQGLLIMEDWQSFLPEDVKEYAKKNLRLEFRVESLREAPNDPWPLALYSWGNEQIDPKL